MQTIKNQFFTTLSNLYTNAEKRELWLAVAGKIFNFSRTELLRGKECTVSAQQAADFRQAAARLAGGEPVQYVTGVAEFYGMQFAVDEHVLVPRPETEELVEWILTENQQIAERKPLKILDIGTGSGCIAVALAKNLPQAEVFAMDISEKALRTAAKNAARNQVKVNFFKYDILDTFTIHNSQFTIIVSNPPYIPENERVTMHKTVVDFEPHTALFVPAKNPLLFYEKIAQFAQNHLLAGGKLYVEIHRDFGRQTADLLRHRGFQNIVLKKDISGNDRMIFGDFYRKIYLSH